MTQPTRHGARWLLLLLCCLTFSAQAQRKVKYKDLFPLLQQQDWTSAEPFLRRFMIQDPDYPNANLQMGLMFDHKARQVDVLGDSELMEAYVDSANIYYERAMELIDDREIRRRDEYYLAYNRRDLRTGKFGIQLSDIQVDLENKMKALTTRVEKVDELQSLVVEMDNTYAEAVSQYQGLVNDFESQRRLFLLADKNTLDRLSELEDTYEKAIELHELYASTMAEIKATNYDTELTIKEIEEFSRDGQEKSSFTKEDAVAWNYQSWAALVNRTIEEEITPLRAELVEYDAQFSVLYGDFLSGIDIRGSLDLNPDLIDKLDRLDPNGFPQKLFTYKAKELEYYQAERNLHDPAETDSVMVFKEVNQTESVAALLSEVETAYQGLVNENLAEAVRAYPNLISKRYNDREGFNDFLENREKFIVQERNQVDRYLTEWKKRDVQGIWSPDTVISLAMDSVNTETTIGANTLVVEEFKEENIWVGGMFYNPGTIPTGYVALFGPERHAKWRHQISLDSFPNQDSLLQLVTSVLWKDDKVQYIIFYNEHQVGENFPGLVARIDQGELSWQAPVVLNGPVIEVKYREFEEDIKFYLQGPEGSAEGSNYLVVSNTGEVQLPTEEGD